MFVPNIKSLCDDRQQAEWLPLCRDWKMIGCYAQTELGHVSVTSRVTCHLGWFTTFRASC
jgi:alkylation response protein AidB-like acyl-CoA dehydrogenase